MTYVHDIPWKKYGIIVELARRFENVSPQFGKTALQKMVYLLTTLYNVPSGYDHTLYTYGPYSSELAVDAEFVVAMGGVYLQEGHRGGYEIKVANKADWIQSKSESFISIYEQEFNDLVDKFGEYNARELELRSTLIFLAKSEKLTSEKLKKQLFNLKPYFTEGEILETIDELISHSFIDIN